MQGPFLATHELHNLPHFLRSASRKLGWPKQKKRDFEQSVFGGTGNLNQINNDENQSAAIKFPTGRASVTVL
jgi:hypothetical protein